MSVSPDNSNWQNVTMIDNLYNVRRYTIPASCLSAQQIYIKAVKVSSNEIRVGGFAILGEVGPVDPQIVGRYIFYNNSYYDGGDPNANASDANAIAADKSALLPGQSATFANYTSYTGGINGIMIDNAIYPGTPTAGDFVFMTGNDNSPVGWTPAPAPASIVTQPNAGVGNADRTTITWADGAIKNTWLQVVVLPTANTGLTLVDIFYFGNAPGETGNSAADAMVTPADELSARQNPHTYISRALVSDRCDFNRDGLVDAMDEIMCRLNGTNFLTALKLITVP